MVHAIELKKISAGYDDLIILSEVSINVKKGSIVALIGQNGAGKSTLLKVIAGVISPKIGKSTVCGVVSYMPQGIRVFSNLTVKENILLASKLNVIPEHIHELFPTINSLEKKLARDLSGGEQQMVALARCLISSPDVLLLDEPSLGLSPKLVKNVFSVINQLNKEFGITIVIVEHNLTSMLSVLDEAFILEKGRVVKVVQGEGLTDLDGVYRSILGI